MSDTPLQILGIGGGVDKNGVVSIEVPFWVASLSEAISHKPSLDITLPLVSRNFKQAEDGGYEVTLGKTSSTPIPFLLLTNITDAV